MREVILPKPVIARNRLDGKRLTSPEGIEDPPWNLLRYLLVWVFTEEKWATSLIKQRQSARVLDAIEAAMKSKRHRAKIAEDDWSAVRDTLNSKEFSVPAPLNSLLIDIADSWLEAKVESAKLTKEKR